MHVDQINAAFEFAGTLFVSASIWRAWCDKSVAGVSWTSPAFFFVWGLWNLIYYPSLGQWWSLAGGVCLSAANGVWIAQLLYYRGRSGSVAGSHDRLNPNES